MSVGFTIQDLIEHFEKKVQQISRYNSETAVGNEPNYPMMVIYLGDEAMKGYINIFRNISEVWPQYQEEIKFIGVENTANTESYYHLKNTDNFMEKNKITEQQIIELASSLFGLKNHFKDRNRLLIYYILDTTNIIDINKYKEFLKILERIRKIFENQETDILDMLIIFLNETLQNQKIARQIRNQLCNQENSKCKSTFILSNKRSDNVIIEDWNLCYRIVACIIFLSNNSDVKIIQIMFGRMLLTASYAREEKPSYEIGQVIVKDLIKRLNKAYEEKSVKLLDDTDILKRLGITKEGTFEIMDEYVYNSLVSMLPSDKQLELFPRKSLNGHIKLSSLSINEFNSITMDALESYLKLIVEQVKEKVSVNTSMKQLWKDKYARLLQINFTVNERIYLYEHINEVKEKMTCPFKLSKESNILLSTITNLKYMLSSEGKLVDIFLDVIIEEGKKALNILDFWKSLLESGRNIFLIHDQNIIKFYEYKVRDYFDYHNSELMEKFRQIPDVEMLKQFLLKTLDQIVDSDNIFSDPFEIELDQRINGEGVLTVDAKQYILQKLTSENAYSYLQVNFSYGNPLISAILLKVGTLLYENLYNNLDSDTYYYDTGCANAAEAINIYEITYQNLINDEGR